MKPAGRPGWWGVTTPNRPGYFPLSLHPTLGNLFFHNGLDSRIAQ